MVYDLFTNGLRTICDLFTNRFQSVYGIKLANGLRNAKKPIMRLTCPGFFCDCGHVCRFFVNPGLLVMFHSSLTQWEDLSVESVVSAVRLRMSILWSVVCCVETISVCNNPVHSSNRKKDRKATINHKSKDIIYLMWELSRSCFNEIVER